MFDGVHLGHQFVLRQVVEKARQLGLQSLCITFDHSPRCEQVLTSLDQKLSLIRQTGIDRCEVLSFTPELKALTAQQFMEQVLKRQLGVKVLLTGYDNRFGRNREEGFEDYVRYGRELDIEVFGLPAEGNTSSTYIRQLLLGGNVAEAAASLGHPYTITGRVTHGEHVGTRLGYPTANLIPADSHQLIPAGGVYAVWVGIDSTQGSGNNAELTSKLERGMMNIGTRPTFGLHTQTLEVHLLDYSGDLYNRQLTITFVNRLREEQHFDSPEALIEQLKEDTIQTKKLL